MLLSFLALALAPAPSLSHTFLPTPCHFTVLVFFQVLPFCLGFQRAGPLFCIHILYNPEFANDITTLSPSLLLAITHHHVDILLRPAAAAASSPRRHHRTHGLEQPPRRPLSERSQNGRAKRSAPVPRCQEYEGTRRSPCCLCFPRSIRGWTVF